MINEEGDMSPSAFIPFCDFGGDMLSMGVKIEQFEFPVCNSFQPKILNDQLCYEVDLKRIAKKHNVVSQLKLGLNFIMDYNEDQQYTLEESIVGEATLANRASASVNSQQHHASIFINTIGNYFTISINLLYT